MVASRYRALRGKSVSEPRRDPDEVFTSDESMDGIAPHPLRFKKSGWLKRPKTQEHLSTQPSMDDLHSHLEPVPSLPVSQKEHTDTTRPKAAIMPPRPSFGQSRSPTPLGLRKADQCASPLVPTVDEKAFSDKIATCGDVLQDQRQENTKPANSDHAPRKAAEQAPEKPKEQHEEQPTELEAITPVHTAPRRDLSPFSKTVVETDRLLAEQERLLHQQLMSPEFAGASVTSLTSTSTFAFTTRTPPKSPIFGKIGSFVRGRTARAATLSPAPSTAPSLSSSHTQSTEPLLSRLGYTHQLMTPPESPISPPPHRHSMHHVYVRYRGEYTTIPIVDTTDTVDILRQASELMTNPISPSASVVFECYSSLGLERRLRRYERVGEVVDSWPRDALNSLIIRHASAPLSDKDLDFASVPQTPPEFVLQLSHCTSPGKWQKRWVTLLRDGNIITSKKPTSNFPDKDCQRICHLSGCDIYTPVSEPASLLDGGSIQRKTKSSPRTTPIKSLKPPKKHVFALKSQNRPASYLDPDNYVQYFCTDDHAIASEFRDLIHAWRSWYMVKVLRQSQQRNNNKRLLIDTKITDPPPQITPVKYKPKKSVGYLKVTPQHKVKVSRDETPHTIGDVTAEPLVDVDRFFKKPLEEYGDDWIPVPRQSGVMPPNTPGTVDSGVEMGLSPSISKDSDGDKDAVEVGSPSEDRRKRREANKAALAAEASNRTTQLITTAEGTAGVSVSVTEPQPEGDTPWTPSAPPQPPKIQSWLPSAAEHTAQLKSKLAALERRTNALPAPQQQQQYRSPVIVAPLPTSTRHNSLQPGNHHNPSTQRRRTRRAAAQQQGQQQQQQHPSANANYKHHSTRTAQILPPELCSDYMALTRFMNKRESLLTPAGGAQQLQRMLTARPSMPALSKKRSSASLSAKLRGGGGGGGVPQLWRDEPSGTDKNSNSNSRPSTSGEGRSAASKLAQGQRSRGASVGGVRRGSEQTAPPPVPGVPVHLRTAVRSGEVRVAAGMSSASAPGMLVDGRGWMVRPGPGDVERGVGERV